VNKATIEALIKSGAFDSLHGRPKRAAMCATIEQAVAAGQKAARDKAAGQGALDVKTPDGGGTYNPWAPGAPLTIYASGVRNAYSVIWHSNGQLYAPTNGSAAHGATPGYDGTSPLPQWIDGATDVTRCGSCTTNCTTGHSAQCGTVSCQASKCVFGNVPDGTSCGAGVCCGGTCGATTETNCSDGVDNNCDGLIDCQDTTACPAPAGMAQPMCCNRSWIDVGSGEGLVIDGKEGITLKGSPGGTSLISRDPAATIITINPGALATRTSACSTT
jgi:hypothetical protein